MRPRSAWAVPVSAAALFLGLPAVGVAGADRNDWRATYDMALMWVNFFILVALLVKYLRKPLRGFLKARWEAMAVELQRLESEKAGAEAAIQAFHDGLEARRAQTEDFHRRLLERGRRERQEQVASALRQAEILIQGARDRAENRIREAREALKAEMVDGAVERAMNVLPPQIGPADEQRWLDRFTDQVLGKR